jgi:hypothetical protein
MSTLTFLVSRLLSMMISSLVAEVAAVAVVVVDAAIVAIVVTVSVRVVAAEVRAEDLLLTTATSLLYEHISPAHAALTKVNVKCLSHVTHAFRCK